MLEAVALVVVLVGCAFCLVGAVGVLRFPDVFSRMHSAGIMDTIGAFLILVGLMPLAVSTTQVGGDGPPYFPMARAIIGAITST